MRMHKTTLRLSVLIAGALAASDGRADAPPAKKLAEADVLKLVELQIDDQAVIDRLKKGGGVDFAVDDAVVGRLKKAGASERVLGALRGTDAVIAHGPHDSGTTLEITEIKRTSDGCMQVSFDYRNPTDKPITVYGPTYVADKVSGVYYFEPKKHAKRGIAVDKDGQRVGYYSAFKEMIAPANGPSPTYWLKMESPDAGVDKATFYFPEAPPIEDVPLPPPLKK